MLNSDKLGKKGEARFVEVCTDADLVCNQAQYDRTGWDFIVEFPFSAPSASGPTLETRATPLSCHVQVKTLQEHNDKFKMRLSSAEHLAKELKPTFVYVLKVNSDLQFTGACLVHLLDAPLGKILKRLRKEDIAGNVAPNRKTITMSAARDGVCLAPTGEALRKAILAACGADVSAYATKKNEQLRTLGFEGRPYGLKLVLELHEMEDVVDAFLGLKQDVPAKDLESEETRFGLRKRIPDLSDESATISIQPSPFDGCTITVRSDPLSPPAVFKGEIFFPGIPNLSDEHRKTLIKTDLFQLAFRRDSWSILPTPHIPPQKPSVWAAYWRFAQVLAKGSGTVQLTSNTTALNLIFNVTERAISLHPDSCEAYRDLSEWAAAILKFAGITEEPTLTVEQLVDSHRQISIAHRLINPHLGLQPLSFKTDACEPVTSPLALDMVYIDFVPLGSMTLGYYGLTQVIGKPTDDAIVWQSENVALKSIVELRQLPDDYAKLKERAEKETGCCNFWVRQYLTEAELLAGAANEPYGVMSAPS